jgi:hypothetical protein
MQNAEVSMIYSCAFLIGLFKQKNRRFLIPIAMVTSMVRSQNKGYNPEGVE